MNNFTDISLRKSHFNYVDFRPTRAYHGQFNGVDLSEAIIENSDLSDTVFNSRVRFRCLHTGEHPELNRTNFFGTKMARADFIETEIDRVDFSGAMLKNATFECESRGRKRSTTLDSLWLANTDLSSAIFDDAKILNIDFTATILDYSEFIDVEFENAVFPKDL